MTPDGLVYLDGNSLGMAPDRRARAAADGRRREWAEGLIRSWDHWLDLPRTGRRPAGADHRGAARLGRRPRLDDRQPLPARPRRPGASPATGRSPSTAATSRPTATSSPASPRRRARRCGPRLDDLDGVAVVVRSAVDYRTAERADIAAETARATAAGAVTVWDLSHAAGAVEVDVVAAGVDLAVGCTYKFLHGGPGAPAWSYVRARRCRPVEQPIWGWFAQAAQFEMGAALRAARRRPPAAARHAGHPRAGRRRGRHRPRRRRRDGGRSPPRAGR